MTWLMRSSPSLASPFSDFVKQFSASLRRDALALAKAGIRAADAEECVRRSTSLNGTALHFGSVRLRASNFDRIYLVSVGKAAVPMASALEVILGGRLTGGLVVTKHGHATQRLRRLKALESGHPVPDADGLDAALQVEELARNLNARDLLIVALSGGASSLLPAPQPPITLPDKQAATDALLKAGADIFQLNAVRKHLSTLKGGRLAALAYPATVVGLLLSDVIGDPLDVIGSGPTAPDPTSFEDALAVISKFELSRKIPAVVSCHLELGARGSVPETPKHGDKAFTNVHNLVIGSNRLALKAAAQKAKLLGYKTAMLSSTMQGETSEVAWTHAQILKECIASGSPLRRPACLISGGETTVTVRGKGRGGRNQEFALASAIAIAGLPSALVMSIGTDGTDGPTDAAGAFADGQTVARARDLGLDAGEYLANNDAYRFFDGVGGLVKTGPTGTNVMDIHLLLAR